MHWFKRITSCQNDNINCDIFESHKLDLFIKIEHQLFWASNVIFLKYKIYRIEYTYIKVLFKIDKVKL